MKQNHGHVLMALCKRDITPLLTHWSYVSFAWSHCYDMGYFLCGGPLDVSKVSIWAGEDGCVFSSQFGCVNPLILVANPCGGCSWAPFCVRGELMNVGVRGHALPASSGCHCHIVQWIILQMGPRCPRALSRVSGWWPATPCAAFVPWTGLSHPAH